MEAGPDTYIDGRGRENTARYLNYACYPNCEASIERGRVWIRSVRTIEANEELTLDFGEQYARAFFWRSGCLCAACRRRR